VDTVVWAKATEHRSNADRAIKASTTNRAPKREELSFNIVNLPFGIVLIGILLTIVASRTYLPEAIGNFEILESGTVDLIARQPRQNQTKAKQSPKLKMILGGLKQFSRQPKVWAVRSYYNHIYQLLTWTNDRK
jgi:hypothetical protein